MCRYANTSITYTTASIATPRVLLDPHPGIVVFSTATQTEWTTPFLGDTTASAKSSSTTTGPATSGTSLDTRSPASSVPTVKPPSDTAPSDTYRVSERTDAKHIIGLALVPVCVILVGYGVYFLVRVLQKRRAARASGSRQKRNGGV
jgi:hypothetical protein